MAACGDGKTKSEEKREEMLDVGSAARTAGPAVRPFEFLATRERRDNHSIIFGPIRSVERLIAWLVFLHPSSVRLSADRLSVVR